MKLSEVFDMIGDKPMAEFYRERAFQRLQNGANLSPEMARVTNFDKLVPHLDR
jgi:hypothetical protein